MLRDMSVPSALWHLVSFVVLLFFCAHTHIYIYIYICVCVYIYINTNRDGGADCKRFAMICHKSLAMRFGQHVAKRKPKRASWLKMACCIPDPWAILGHPWLSKVGHDGGWLSDLSQNVHQKWSKLKTRWNLRTLLFPVAKQTIPDSPKLEIRSFDPYPNFHGSYLPLRLGGINYTALQKWQKETGLWGRYSHYTLSSNSFHRVENPSMLCNCGWVS